MISLTTSDAFYLEIVSLYNACALQVTVTERMTQEIMQRVSWNTVPNPKESNVVFYGAILTHWGRVTPVCVGKLTIIGSDNGLSPGRRQTIIWTNAGILLIGPLGTNFSEIVVGIQAFSFKKIHLKMSSAKWRPFCLGLNVLRNLQPNIV